jgi:ribonuclease BN (tRNA processing enzyme)
MLGVGYTCIGSGTCVPRASRGPACHLVQAGELRILLDIGSGSLRTLARLGEDFSTLTAVGLTHRHMDHVGDLLPLFFALRHTPGLDRSDPLQVFGYSGLHRDLERLSTLFGRWVLEPRVPLEIAELEPGAALALNARGARATVAAGAVNHTAEAVGFRLEITQDGEGVSPLRTITYSGDTGATDSLIGLARDADLFVCECAFPDDQRVEGHLTPSELLPICAAARPRSTVATHLYPVWDERGVDRLWREALVRFGSDLPVTPAYDGLRIELAEGTGPEPVKKTGPSEARVLDRDA